MKKTPTLFIRNQEKMSEVLPKTNPACQWVLDGEGVATRMFDGTCCTIDEAGLFWKRRAVRKGKRVPDDFVECDYDPNTGKRFGWVPVVASDKFHLEALDRLQDRRPRTYELVGPKINGNPERWPYHELIFHGFGRFIAYPKSFGGIRSWLEDRDIEGVVWHHPNGRMAKIKLRDFGLRRPDA